MLASRWFCGSVLWGSVYMGNFIILDAGWVDGILAMLGTIGFEFASDEELILVEISEYAGGRATSRQRGSRIGEE